MILDDDHLKFGNETWVKVVQESEPPQGPILDPAETWVYFGHDYQIGGWWSGYEEEGILSKILNFFRRAVGAKVSREYIDCTGYNRVYPETRKNHRPETVATYEKENRVNLSPAWDQFNKDLFLLSAFKEVDRSRFSEIKVYFDFAMADNRVIVNNAIYPQGYMPLAMGGNIGHVIGEDSFPNFGACWKIEALNSTLAPPDPMKVFFEEIWKWSKATITRWAKPEENVQGLANPWQHVVPFTHIYWPGGCHVPLMLISKTGYVHIPKGRCLPLTDGSIPDPYNPPRGWLP